MYSPTSSGSASAKSSRVGNRANSAGVTRLTRASVHWAERRVAIRSWSGSRYCREQIPSGYRSFSASTARSAAARRFSISFFESFWPAPAGFGTLVFFMGSPLLWQPSDGSPAGGALSRIFSSQPKGLSALSVSVGYCTIVSAICLPLPAWAERGVVVRRGEVRGGISLLSPCRRGCLLVE